jgi:hypothetical protein
MKTKKTDWTKKENRERLQDALESVANNILVLTDAETRGHARPDGWVDFLHENDIKSWGTSSDEDIYDLRYKYQDHVWIRNPDLNIQDGLEEFWESNDDYYMCLFVPYKVAERLIAA